MSHDSTVVLVQQHTSSGIAPELKQLIQDVDTLGGGSSEDEHAYRQRTRRSESWVAKTVRHAHVVIEARAAVLWLWLWLWL